MFFVGPTKRRHIFSGNSQHHKDKGKPLRGGVWPVEIRVAMAVLLAPVKEHAPSSAVKPDPNLWNHVEPSEKRGTHVCHIQSAVASRNILSVVVSRGSEAHVDMILGF